MSDMKAYLAQRYVPLPRQLLLVLPRLINSEAGLTQ